MRGARLEGDLFYSLRVEASPASSLPAAFSEGKMCVASFLQVSHLSQAFRGAEQLGKPGV